MTVLHTGSTKKYSANWQDIFAKGKKQPAAKKAAAKKAAKKSKPAAGKRKAAKK